MPLPISSNARATAPPHILIVDDDPEIRDLPQEYFTSNLLRVSVTSSAKEMTGILVDHSIDLVVLDLRLPGEDGMVLQYTAVLGLSTKLYKSKQLLKRGDTERQLLLNYRGSSLAMEIGWRTA
jgi:response regulator of citrate/malate metabolism